MRKLISTFVLACSLGAALISSPSAAPVSGFETLYDAVFNNCTIPRATLATCEAAINAYASAIVTAVELEVANQSFTELRAEVLATNVANAVTEADTALQADIDELFELLLPDSGAVGPLTSPI